MHLTFLEIAYACIIWPSLPMYLYVFGAMLNFFVQLCQHEDSGYPVLDLYNHTAWQVQIHCWKNINRD